MHLDIGNAQRRQQARHIGGPDGVGARNQQQRHKEALVGRPQQTGTGEQEVIAVRLANRQQFLYRRNKVTKRPLRAATGARRHVEEGAGGTRQFKIGKRQPQTRSSAPKAVRALTKCAQGAPQDGQCAGMSPGQHVAGPQRESGQRQQPHITRFRGNLHALGGGSSS